MQINSNSFNSQNTNFRSDKFVKFIPPKTKLGDIGMLDLAQIKPDLTKLKTGLIHDTIEISGQKVNSMEDALKFFGTKID